MKVIHIALLMSIALHLVSANCNSNCKNNNCNSQPCNSNNCNSKPCFNNNCNSQPCNSNNCNSQPCNSNNCNSQPCNSNNCNSQPCNSNDCNSQPCNSNDCNSQPCNSNDCNNQPCNNCNSKPCNTKNCDEQPCNESPEERDEIVPVLVPMPNNDNQATQESKHSINNTNINNSTTTITLTNTINTVNNISVPISVNSTNENTVHVHFDSTSVQNTTEIDGNGCCLVTKPVNCTNDGHNCTMVKQWECSDICRGVFPGNENAPIPEVPVVPQPVVPKIYIVQQPFLYQPPTVQQPPVMWQPSGCGTSFCLQQYPFPFYYPVQTHQANAPVGVSQTVGARQVVIQPEQEQGVLSRLLLNPYGNYYGGGYQGNVQSGYQQMQNYMVPKETACPYSNSGYPSPCQQTPQIV